MHISDWIFWGVIINPQFLKLIGWKLFLLYNNVVYIEIVYQRKQRLCIKRIKSYYWMILSIDVNFYTLPWCFFLGWSEAWYFAEFPDDHLEFVAASEDFDSTARCYTVKTDAIHLQYVVPHVQACMGCQQNQHTQF